MPIVTPIPRIITYFFSLFGLLLGLTPTLHSAVLPSTPVMVASWQGNPEPDIESYTIHYGTHPDALHSTANVGKETAYAFDDLQPGAVYYCAVKAKNTAGLESEMSGVAAFLSPLIDPSMPLAEAWLLGHGFDTASPMNVDHNGDGVSLLTSYALNLNPLDNPVASLPQARIANGRLELRFFAGRDDVTYQVEASPDMETWSTAGVTLSAIDPQMQRTGSVPLSGGNRFLRLMLVR